MYTQLHFLVWSFKQLVKSMYYLAQIQSDENESFSNHSLMCKDEMYKQCDIIKIFSLFMHGSA